MKDLETYVKEIRRYRLPDVLGYRTLEEFMYVNNITEESLTEDDIHHYMNLIYNLPEMSDEDYDEYMYETRVSHDPDSYILKLKSAFGNKLFDFDLFDVDGKPNGFFFYVKREECDELLQSNEFKRLQLFYNYNKTKTKRFTKPFVCQVFMEPNVTNDMTDYVYDKCGGILYHITETKNKDRILESGLRAKVTTEYDIDDEFKDLYVRVYCDAISDSERDDTNKILKYTKENNMNKRNEECCVIKIDLNELSDVYKKRICFYKDVRTPNEHAVYTFTYIPKECLSLYKERI